MQSWRRGLKRNCKLGHFFGALSLPVSPLLQSCQDPHIPLRSQKKCPEGHLFAPRHARYHHQWPSKITFNTPGLYIQMIAEPLSGASEKLLSPVYLRLLWNLEPPSKSTSHLFLWPLCLQNFLLGEWLWFLKIMNSGSEPSPLKTWGHGFWGPRWIHRHWLVIESTLGSRSQPGTKDPTGSLQIGVSQPPAWVAPEVRWEQQTALSWGQASVPVPWCHLVDG